MTDFFDTIVWKTENVGSYHQKIDTNGFVSVGMAEKIPNRLPLFTFYWIQVKKSQNIIIFQ